MKTMLTAFIILSSLNSFAVNRESGGRESASAVYVNFFSPGNGINYEAYDLTRKLMNEAEDQGKIQELTIEFYGREGERKVCLKYKRAEDSRELVRMIAPTILADKFSRTKVYIGKKCGDMESATQQDISKY